MSKEKSSSSNNGIGAGFMLFLVFLVLKLTGFIGWSWWWVTAPLWGGFAIFLAVLVIVFAFATGKASRS